MDKTILTHWGQDRFEVPLSLPRQPGELLFFLFHNRPLARGLIAFLAQKGHSHSELRFAVATEGLSALDL